VHINRVLTHTVEYSDCLPRAV